MEAVRPLPSGSTTGWAVRLLGAVVLALAVTLLTTSAPGIAPTAAPAAAQEDTEEDAGDAGPVLEYYGTDACPFCREMQPFLDSLEERFPGLEVARFDVEDRANAARWEEQMAARGEQAQGVPTAILGDEVWVGFNDQIAADITRTVADTPGVDEPREDADDGVAAPAEEDGSGGPSLVAIAIGAAVVLAVAVALFAPRRARGDQG